MISASFLPYPLWSFKTSTICDFILIAAGYRPDRLIEVRDVDFPGTRNVITDKSPAFYEPYQTDHDGANG